MNAKRLAILAPMLLAGCMPVTIDAPFIQALAQDPNAVCLHIGASVYTPDFLLVRNNGSCNPQGQAATQPIIVLQNGKAQVIQTAPQPIVIAPPAPVATTGAAKVTTTTVIPPAPPAPPAPPPTTTTTVTPAPTK